MIEEFNVALIIFAIGYLIAYVVYLIKTSEVKTITELKEQDIRLNKLCFDYQEKEKWIAELEAQIEKMKSDVREMAEQADKNGDMLALKRMNELFEKWR